MVKNCKSRMSKDEAYSLIEEYFSSGEQPGVFYRREGISDKQFYAWRQRYLRDQPSLSKKLGVYLTGKSPRNASSRLSTKDKPSVSDKVFARVEVSDSMPAATPTAAISANHSYVYELCYPNGVMLRLPICISTSSLLELIRLY